MSTAYQVPWYKRSPEGWKHFRSIPLARLRPLIIAVFVLFSTFGYFDDIMAGGAYPYSILVSNVVFSGLIACLWILILSRKPFVWLFVLIPIQILSPFFLAWFAKVLSIHFPAAPATAALGIRISAIGMMVSIVLSYVFFIFFIRGEGKESFKLRNELELAHGIQKTLVPPVSLHTSTFRDLRHLQAQRESRRRSGRRPRAYERRRHRLSRRHRRSRIAGRNPHGDAEDRGPHRAARGS